MARLGYRAAPGQPNRMISPTGEVVTRASYRNAIAQSEGYRNERARRGNVAADNNYFGAFLNSEAGQSALAQARAAGKTDADLRAELIAARNAKPSGRRAGGQAYYDFFSEYDFDDYADWFDY